MHHSALYTGCSRTTTQCLMHYIFAVMSHRVTQFSPKCSEINWKYEKRTEFQYCVFKKVLRLGSDNWTTQKTSVLTAFSGQRHGRNIVWKKQPSQNLQKWYWMCPPWKWLTNNSHLTTGQQHHWLVLGWSCPKQLLRICTKWSVSVIFWW